MLLNGSRVLKMNGGVHEMGKMIVLFHMYFARTEEKTNLTLNQML